MIFLYLNNGCCKCHETKKFLEDRNKVFEERHSDRIWNPKDSADCAAFMQVLFCNRKLPIIVEIHMPYKFSNQNQDIEIKGLMRKLIEKKLKDSCNMSLCMSESL